MATCIQADTHILYYCRPGYFKNRKKSAFGFNEGGFFKVLKN